MGTKLATLVIAVVTFAGCTKAGVSKAGTVLMVTGGIVSGSGAAVTAGCSGDERPCGGSGEETNAGVAAGFTVIAVGGILALIGLLLCIGEGFGVKLTVKARIWPGALGDAPVRESVPHAP